MAELIDLKSIEGRFSPHDAYLRSQLERRKVCLAPVQDPQEMASYVGGLVEESRTDEKWCVSKELFPGVFVHLMFRSDEEFGPRLEAFFSGPNVRDVPGEDLAELAIATVNHMIRHVRSVVPPEELPEVCRRI
jgi:hypothetical protein